MLPDSWHSDLQERQLAKPSAPETCPVFRRKSCAQAYKGEYVWTEYGNASPMSHLLGHIKSHKSDQSEVHFIAFKDHADDPQYLTAATLPGTYHQKLDLFKKFSTWHRRKKTSCEGKVRKKIENNSKVIWFHSVFRQILIIENLKGSKRTNCRCQGLICPWTSWSTTWEMVSSLELGHGISYATVVKRRCEAGWCQVKTLRPRGLHRFEDKDGNPVPKYVPKESGKDVLVPISGSKK